MNDSRRRVTMFMIAGVIAAIIAGFAVWKMSLPSSPEPDYRADGGSTRESATAATHTAHNATGAAGSPKTHSEAGAGRDTGIADRAPDTAGSAHASADASGRDPLLPPNAVVNAAPRAAAPTQVYRPSNVVPTSVARQADGAQAETPAATGSAPAEPTATAPESTGATATATQTASSTEPTTPTSSAPLTTQPTPAANQVPTPAADAVAQLVPGNTAEPAAEQQPVEQYTPGSTGWWNRVWGYLR